MNKLEKLVDKKINKTACNMFIRKSNTTSTNEENQMEKMADYIIECMEKYPREFNNGNVIIHGLSNPKEREEVERFIEEKRSNIIITHDGRETDENMWKQIERINEIYDNGMKPMFLNLSELLNNEKKTLLKK